MEENLTILEKAKQLVGCDDLYCKSSDVKFCRTCITKPGIKSCREIDNMLQIADFVKRSEEDKEKRRKAMLGKKYDATVGQKHKDYCNTKSKEYWSEYFKNIKRKTKRVKSLITGVTYSSVKEARETENVTIAIMTRKLKKGEDYIYVD